MKATVSATRSSTRTSQGTATGARSARTSRRSSAASRAYARRAQRAGAPAEETTTRERAAVVRQRAPFVASIIALLSAGLVVTLYLTTKATQSTYELDKAHEQNQRLAAVLAQLQRDVEAAEAAPELAAKARSIGMVPSSDPAHLVVGKNGHVTLVGTPTPASASPAPLMNTTRAVLVPMSSPNGESIVSRNESTSSDSASSAAASSAAASSDSSTTEEISSESATSGSSTSGSGGTPQTGNTASGPASGEELVPVTAGSESER